MVLDAQLQKAALLKVRILPVVLGAAAGAFLKIISSFGRGSAILSGLGEITLAASAFLLLMLCCNRIKIAIEQSKLDKLYARICKKSKDTNAAPESPEIKVVPDTDGLIDIPAVNSGQDVQPGKTVYKTVLSVIFIVLYAGVTFWHITRMITILPFSHTENYKYGLIHAIALLVFPFVTAVYLRMRKNNGLHAGDKTSQGILMLVSYTSLVFAAVIAAHIVLNINILIVLHWCCYAVSLYLCAVLAVNILVSILKNDVIGSFNYTFIPEYPLINNTKDRNRSDQTADSVLYSEEAKSVFSIKSLWTIRYSLHILPALALLLGLIVYIATTVYVVQPHQQAAVYRFGKLSGGSIKGPGLKCKLPWPVDSVQIYDVNRVSYIQIGYQETTSRNFLWNLAHEGGEYSLLLGNGNEVAAVNIKLLYKITDLYSYITVSAAPQEILSAAAYNAIMRRTVNTTLDTFLSVDRNFMSSSLTQELSALCGSKNLGIDVIQVIIESIHPPVDVADVYQKVVTASVDKNTVITNAQAAAEKRVIYAEQQSLTLINRAKAEQHRRMGNAHREMAVYYAALEAFKVNPQSFRLTKYLDTYEKIIKEHKVYVFSPKTENEMSNFVISENSVIRIR
ncbi:MAG: SPFH domain-containing protein [Treponema sp.]|nr:SPFH domain-containing protein [Treponema sp.]